MHQNNFSKQTILLFFFLKFSSNVFSQQTIAEWNFPNIPDNAIVDISVPINSGSSISTQGGTGVIAFNQVGASTFAANATGWQNGMNTKWWEISIATTGFINLTVSSKQFSSSTGPRDFKIQYKIGAGVWNDLPGATSIVLAANFSSGVVNAIPLPSVCENQPQIYLRWIMTSNTTVSGGTVASGGNSRIDEINISWNSDSYFRTISSGDWNNVNIWESSIDNVVWSAAIMPPSNYAKTITVRNGHIVMINSIVNIDETIVENGATLNWNSFFINIFNGPGIDLQIQGVFIDGCSNSVSFLPGATWNLGSASTIIKTNMGSSNNWRDAYDGGISNINPTATFIIRKVTGNNPSVSSLTMYYPNLIIENYTASHWIASGFSGFQGTTTTIFVKGSLDIGGAGTNSVEFENNNNNAAPTVVMGNLLVRANNTLRNYGTGFELFSNLICDGSIIYDANGSRKLQFSGSASQQISGVGNLHIYNLTLNKNSNGLTLLKPLTIDNSLIFNNPGGKIYSSLINKLSIENGASVSGVSNTGFVDGPVRKIGNQPFIFPVGKNNSYRSVAIGAGASSNGSVFWSENFGNGCNIGQLASGFTSVIGTWNVAVTGVNDVGANDWFVSASTNGMLPGNCETSCGNNQTLHISSTYPNTDQGAIYFDSNAGTCPGTTPCSYTDKMVQSPVINCAGRTNINISFNYFHGGDYLNDNTFMWYFDGLVWNQLIDLPKTLCCGNIPCTGSAPGVWTSYSIALPATANNNPNLKIGFRWINNGDGVQSNPSIAIDDINVSGIPDADVFTAEYFRANPQTDFNNLLNPFLHHISNCEYWIVNRENGITGRNVTLSWDANSGGISFLNDLTIANFNGTSWNDEGNGNVTGNTTSGTITSALLQNNFGPFTLASTSLTNPLPVELTSFTAKQYGKLVCVSWQTASEIKSKMFEILRSEDGINFTKIGAVKAAGQSSVPKNYFFNDTSPLSGTSYYQLMQTDIDGISELSEIVAVNFIDENFNITAIEINSMDTQLTIHFETKMNENISVKIFEITGRMIFTTKFYITADMQSLKTGLPLLSKGVYVLEITQKENSVRRMFNLH